MPRFFKQAGFLPTLLLIVLTALLTHALWIPRLGYYHDDWYMLWSGASRGAESIVPLFAMDRPFMGVIYSGFYRVLGDSIPGWHLFALLWRVVGAAAFYWILQLVFPGRRWLYALAAMIFVAFPGFLALPNAATKVNHLIGYAAALLSIALTLYAAKASGTRRWIAVAGALALMAFYLWIYEYMIGLEAMRVLLLFWVLWQGRRGAWFAAAKRVVVAYMPYIVVVGLFLFWRVFIFESTRNATDLRGLVTDYQTNFGGMVVRLAFQTLKDFLSTSVFAWAVQPYHLFARATSVEIALALAAGAVIVLLALGYLRLARAAEPAEEDAATGNAGASPWVMVILGALIALAAVVPVVASNRHIDLLDAYKGYALHPSAGVMIAVTGLALMLKPRFRQTALLALLALSVVTLTLNAQRWANFWEIQRSFWWQLTWRAPNLAENTLVMAYLPDGYALQQDYEVWGPVNLIYRPLPDSVPEIQAEVLNADTIVNVFEGVYDDPYVRDIFVPRYYDQLLLLSQPTTRSCIHVIDGTMPAYSASERPIVEQAGAYSRVDSIQTDGAPPAPPADIFGAEPERGWCYYYQQASLARQSGDWARIAALYDEPSAREFRAGDGSETFVFLEGLANSGRADAAREIAARYIRENPALRQSLCQTVTDADELPAGYEREMVRQIVCE